MELLNVCIYLRKSRADREAEARGEGETLARHERILLDLAKKRGYNVGAIYKEIVSGETISARPVMQQLLREVESGMWDGVLVVEVERLARGDTIDQGGLLDRVEDSLDKYNVNTKFQIKPNDWLKFNFNNNITLNLISRPLPDMSILYHQIARSQPNMVTEVPISGLYNLPSWNEALYLDNVGYSQNRISDAMTFAATVTPLKGWDIIGEMKVRFDVQNDEFLQKQPRTTRPCHISDRNATVFRRNRRTDKQKEQ